MPIADTVTLNSGYEMPVIGYGTWQLPKNLAAERVRDALEAGYRHIDSALSFKNQEEVAAGIKDWCKIRKVRVRLKIFGFFLLKIMEILDFQKSCYFPIFILFCLKFLV